MTDLLFSSVQWPPSLGCGRRPPLLDPVLFRAQMMIPLAAVTLLPAWLASMSPVPPTDHDLRLLLTRASDSDLVADDSPMST